MRFLCYRVNQLIQSNQLKLQAFEVKILSMSNIWRSSNSIVSFDHAIEQAYAVRKCFQDRGYSCDETMYMPLNKVFAGINLIRNYGLHINIRAFYENSTEKNTPLTRSKTNQLCKKQTGKVSRCLSNGVYLRAWPPKLFSAEFNAQYEFYGPILSHFFRLLHHPNAYFREVSLFPPMTEKFCNMTSHSPIRCDHFTLYHLDSSLKHSLKWLKDNVRAQNIRLSFNYNVKILYPELHSLVSEFLFLDASICARDRITFDRLPHPGEFVRSLSKKYETMEVAKRIPSILLEDYPYDIHNYFESNLVHEDHPTLIDKFCDKCNVKSYKLQNKIDETRKIIAQVSRCYVGWNCPNKGTRVYINFE